MASNIQMVEEAQKHAEMMLHQDEARMSFSEMVATRQRAAKYIQELANLCLGLWQEKVPAPKDMDKVQNIGASWLPFDQWYVQKTGSSFRNDVYYKGMTVDHFMLRQAEALQEYVSTMVLMRVDQMKRN